MVQILNPQQVLTYMDRVRASGRVRRYPFATGGPGYSQQDPNCFPVDLTYSERIVFGTTVPIGALPNNGNLQNLAAEGASPPAPTTSADGGGALNFNVTPFLATGVSQQVLSSNPRRGALLVQNQDAALTLYFNLGQNAAAHQGIQLGPGIGLLFDRAVPNNYVTVVSVGGNVLGIVCEGS